MSRSSEWIAAQLRARGYPTAAPTVRKQPERVIWERGEPVAFAAPGYAETRLDLIERAYGNGALSISERQALLEEVLERWASRDEGIAE